MSEQHPDNVSGVPVGRALIPASSGARGWWRFAVSTLRMKLLLAFVGVALLPLGLIAYLDYRGTKSTLTAVGYQALHSAAAQTAMRLDTFFSSNMEILGTEAQAPLLAKYLGANANERDRLLEQTLGLLRMFAQKDTAFVRSYALLDLDGRNVLDSEPWNIGADESLQDYFHVALKTGRPYASRVQFPAADGRGYFHLSTPVLTPGGKPLGVLRRRYRATVIQKMVAEQANLVGLPSFAVVLNEDRVFLAYGKLPPNRLSERLYKSVQPLGLARLAELQREQRLPRRPPAEAFVDMPELARGLATAASTEPFFVARLPAVSGEMQAIAVTQMVTQPWFVAFAQPQNSLLAPMHAWARATVFVAIGILALVAAAAIGTAQLLTRPIVRLTAVARQVAEGNIAAKADITTYDETGVLARTFNFMTDKLKETLEGLRRSEEKFRNIYENALEGIYQVSVEGRLLSANPAMARLLGYESAEELLACVNDIRRVYVHPEARASVMTVLLERDAAFGLELEFYRKNLERIWVSIHARIVRDDKGQPSFIEGFASDITERKRAEERIRYLAQHDALTGLPNRVLFQDRIAQAIAQARRDDRQVAVLFIDIDHFKHINDSLGHQIGDRLLRSAARRLQRCVREGDSVARLGGDEFVIGLPMIDNSNDAALVAQKTLEALAWPLVVDSHELHISGSIGISLYPTDGEEVDALMRAADTAMYHAKEKGRNNYQFFTSVLNEAAQSRLIIANRLHHALERGEFALHYQPQVDLESGRIFGTEALIRWRQPEIGMVSPSQFIRVAEETGLIVTLGEWVLREACEQLQRWRNAGYPELQVAVNLSPQQFRRPGFPELAARVLSETGLPARALELELTEGTLMTQSAENVAILEQLAGMGIQLSVDDFGTGYSSLSYLQRFPIHQLKIDQSFVAGIGRDANDTAIVTAVLAMAHSLHLKVVAEGVETTEQAAFLKGHGCLAAQGFYYSKPMTAEALDRLMREQGGRFRAKPSAEQRT